MTEAGGGERRDAAGFYGRRDAVWTGVDSAGRADRTRYATDGHDIGPVDLPAGRFAVEVTYDAGSPACSQTAKVVEAGQA